MHVIIHLLTARLPQTKEANYGYKYLHCHIARLLHISYQLLCSICQEKRDIDKSIILLRLSMEYLMRRRGEYFLLYSIKLRPVTLVPDFTSIGITSKPRWTMNTLFFIKTEISTMLKAVFSKFLQHRCLAYLSSSQHHQWLAVSALFPLLLFVNNRSVKHILIFSWSGKNVEFYTFLIPLLCNSPHFPHLNP